MSSVMARIRRNLLLTFAFTCFSVDTFAAQPTSLALFASSNSQEISAPIQLVFPIQLTATATPAPQDGQITFYDGTAILGVVPVTNGSATLTTEYLLSGKRYLYARFAGSTAFEPSASPVVPVDIFALQSYGFRKSSLPLENGAFLPFYVAKGDFNGDGHLDLVVANQWSNNVSLFLGDGNGNFSEAPNSPLEAGTSPICIIATDFNGDGHLDIVTANYDDGSVSVLFGNGDGTFAYQSKYPVGVHPSSLAVADFDNDGFPDVAVANLSDNSVSIVFGQSSAVSGTPRIASIVVSAGPGSLVAGDFNGDGNADLAVASSQSNAVDVFLGDGKGAFLPPNTLRTDGPTRTIIEADVNNDGSLDLLTANAGDGTLTVFLGDGQGRFTPGGVTVLPKGSQPFALAGGD